MTVDRRFPKRTLRGDHEIYRIHRAIFDPWWFSADGTGRFDPEGTGMGSCYLAERPLGAWVEVFRKSMMIAEPDVRGRMLLSVRLGRDLKLADLTSRRALQYGVTASLGANETYDESHAFAVEAVAAGFDGIRYLVRHDPAQDLIGIALFAAEGAATEPGVWPSDDDGEIPDNLTAEAGRQFRYRVMPVP